MEDTLTLNNGTSDVTFTKRSVDDGTVIWTAPSPQGDYEGTLRCKRTASKARSGVLSRDSEILVPYYVEDTGYQGFLKVRVILTAKSDVPNAEAVKAVALALSAFDSAVNTDYTDNFVEANDAF